MFYGGRVDAHVTSTFVNQNYLDGTVLVLVIGRSRKGIFLCFLKKFNFLRCIPKSKYIE